MGNVVAQPNKGGKLDRSSLWHHGDNYYYKGNKSNYKDICTFTFT